MKVAVISNIPANGVALDAVLAGMEPDRPDRIVCLGGLRALNPQPREGGSAHSIRRAINPMARDRAA